MYPKKHNFLLNTATKSAFILAKQHLALDSYLCFIQAMCLKPLNQQKKKKCCFLVIIPNCLSIYVKNCFGKIL